MVDIIAGERGAKGLLRNTLLILIAITAITPTILCAQPQTTFWYFGNKLGLDFTTGQPVPFQNGSMNSPEGNATISDRVTGALLFYTDGVEVWDRTHTVMPNGNGLKGSVTSAQTAVIAPFPGDDMRYYLFTADAGAYASPGAERGIHYNVVDMRMNGGYGDVVQKNIPVIPRPCTEKLIAVEHANGRDYWVIVQPLNEPTYYAYLVSPSGVSTTPVRSTIINNIGAAWLSYSIGLMEASTDGSRIVSTTANMPHVELLRFNNATGELYDQIVLLDESDVPFPRGAAPYGASFSPSGCRLYLGFYLGGIVQYSLEHEDPQAIRQSVVKISSEYYGSAPSLQIGLDGRIYACQGFSHVGIVHRPDAPGMACNYQPFAIRMEERSIYRVQLGLPNMIDQWFRPRTSGCTSYPFTLIPEGDTTICAGSAITFTSVPANPDITLRWVTPGGTPASAIGNGPIEVLYSTPGIYPVELQYQLKMGTIDPEYLYDTIRGRVTVAEGGGMDIATHIETPDSVSYGDEVEIPLYVDDDLIGLGMREITLRFVYNMNVMRPAPIDAAETDRLLNGTLLAGWAFDMWLINGDELIIHLVAPPGKSLQGKGLLVRMPYQTYIPVDMDLENWQTVEVYAEVISGGCTNIAPAVSTVRLGLCGLSQRLIEGTFSKYNLSVGTRNSGSGEITMNLTLGFDGPTQLEIYDATGTRRQTIADQYMDAGEHVFRWPTSDISSGLYFCRVQSGHWVKVVPVSIVQ